ncbi:hypothetical protein [Flavobacterium sp.]|uniref:hypothetical protein n=1 Tax=Flavobacterium sp. TaxID=239 RepID=UPI003B9CDB8E
MKTKFIIGLLLILANGVYSQKITLTKEGIPTVSISDTRLLPDLKDKIERWAEQSFRNGYDYQDRGEIIRLETIRRNAFTYSSLGETYSYHVKVRLTFILTEGKRRLQIDVLEFMDGQEPSSLKLESLFTSKGIAKAEMTEAVNALEANIQRVVSRLQILWK